MPGCNRQNEKFTAFGATLEQKRFSSWRLPRGACNVSPVPQPVKNEKTALLPTPSAC